MFPFNTTTIRVNRLDFESQLTEEQKKHRSEVELIGFQHDIELYSEDGLENLEKEINDKLGELIKEFNMKKFFNQYASW